jgi:hypothetical protein
MRGLVIGLTGAGAAFMAGFWVSVLVKGTANLTALALGLALIALAVGVLWDNSRRGARR